MEILRPSFEDKNVIARKVYIKASGTDAYVDSTCKVQVGCNELVNAFRKGLIIIGSDGTEYLPVSCSVASKTATVAYITKTASATTADFKTITSKADGE